jgi:pimeloyl-ACP methyl ester carboxylesterase
VRVDEQTISLDRLPVFLRSAQTLGAPVLYLHGVPTSSDDWIPFLEFTGGLAPDLLGFGRTAKGGNLDYSIAGHADFLERLLDELGTERVSLVAHDWGAAGGLAFAQRHPDRVERLVLINALPLLRGFHWNRLGRVWRRPVIGELVMGSIPRWLLVRTLRAGCVRADAWTPERLNAIWEQFDQGTQRAILKLHRSADEPALAAAGADLEALRAPALVVWGDQDPWFAADYAKAYAARLPNAELHLVPDAGHWPWLDRPELVAQIASFLQPA